MLKRGERICPCCGKPLVLMGKVLGDKYHEFELGQKTTIAGDYKETFERDKIWSSGINMYCSECGVKITLSENPFLLIDILALLIVLSAFIASIIAALSGGNIVPAVLPTVLAVEIILLVWAAVRRNNIIKYKSNFTFSTDEAIPIFDGEFDFKPNIHAAAELTEKQRKYFRSGNIFETGLLSSRVFLYLINSRRSGSVCELDFRFCGTVDDAEKFTRSLKNAEKPVTLPLTFEGKSVGTAEVTEIYEIKDHGL